MTAPGHLIIYGHLRTGLRPGKPARRTTKLNPDNKEASWLESCTHGDRYEKVNHAKYFAGWVSCRATIARTRRSTVGRGRHLGRYPICRQMAGRWRCGTLTLLQGFDCVPANQTSATPRCMRERKSTRDYFAHPARRKKSRSPDKRKMNKRLHKNHKRKVSRARERIILSQPDVRTPEQLQAARESSRRITRMNDNSPGPYSSPVKPEAAS